MCGDDGWKGGGGGGGGAAEGWEGGDRIGFCLRYTFCSQSSVQISPKSRGGHYKLQYVIHLCFAFYLFFSDFSLYSDYMDYRIMNVRVWNDCSATVCVCPPDTVNLRAQFISLPRTW